MVEADEVMQICNPTAPEKVASKSHQGPPTRAEAIFLFHKCWDQAKRSPKYDKTKWSRLDECLYALLR